MDEKQFQQVNQNLQNRARNLQNSNQLEPISLSTVELNENKLCACSKPAVSFFAKSLGRMVYSRQCTECEAEAKKQAVENEKEQAREKIRRRISRILPPHYHGASLGDLSDGLFSAITKKPFNQGLYLWGPCGTGKTHAAACLGIELIKQGQSVAFSDFADVLLKIRDRMGITIEQSNSAVIDGVSMFETDQFAIRGLERYALNVHDVGDETTAGPVVGLITAAS